MEKRSNDDFFENRKTTQKKYKWGFQTSRVIKISDLNRNYLSKTWTLLKSSGFTYTNERAAERFYKKFEQKFFFGIRINWKWEKVLLAFDLIH